MLWTRNLKLVSFFALQIFANNYIFGLALPSQVKALGSRMTSTNYPYQDTDKIKLMLKEKANDHPVFYQPNKQGTLWIYHHPEIGYVAAFVKTNAINPVYLTENSPNFTITDTAKNILETYRVSTPDYEKRLSLLSIQLDIKIDDNAKTVRINTNPPVYTFENNASIFSTNQGYAYISSQNDIYLENQKTNALGITKNAKQGLNDYIQRKVTILPLRRAREEGKTTIQLAYSDSSIQDSSTALFMPIQQTPSAILIFSYETQSYEMCSLTNLRKTFPLNISHQAEQALESYRKSLITHLKTPTPPLTIKGPIGSQELFQVDLETKHPAPNEEPCLEILKASHDNKAVTLYYTARDGYFCKTQSTSLLQQDLKGNLFIEKTLLPELYEWRISSHKSHCPFILHIDTLDPRQGLFDVHVIKKKDQHTYGAHIKAIRNLTQSRKQLTPNDVPLLRYLSESEELRAYFSPSWLAWDNLFQGPLEYDKALQDLIAASLALKKVPSLGAISWQTSYPHETIDETLQRQLKEFQKAKDRQTQLFAQNSPQEIEAFHRSVDKIFETQIEPWVDKVFTNSIGVQTLLQNKQIVETLRANQMIAQSFFEFYRNWVKYTGNFDKLNNILTYVIEKLACVKQIPDRYSDRYPLLSTQPCYRFFYKWETYYDDSDEDRGRQEYTRCIQEWQSVLTFDTTNILPLKELTREEAMGHLMDQTYKNISKLNVKTLRSLLIQAHSHQRWAEKPYFIGGKPTEKEEADLKKAEEFVSLLEKALTDLSPSSLWKTSTTAPQLSDVAKNLSSFLQKTPSSGSLLLSEYEFRQLDTLFATLHNEPLAPHNRTYWATIYEILSNYTKPLEELERAKQEYQKEQQVVEDLEKKGRNIYVRDSDMVASPDAIRDRARDKYVKAKENVLKLNPLVLLYIQHLKNLHPDQMQILDLNRALPANLPWDIGLLASDLDEAIANNVSTTPAQTGVRNVISHLQQARLNSEFSDPSDTFYLFKPLVLAAYDSPFIAALLQEWWDTDSDRLNKYITTLQYFQPSFKDSEKDFNTLVDVQYDLARKAFPSFLFSFFNKPNVMATQNAPRPASPSTEEEEEEGEEEEEEDPTHGRPRSISNASSTASSRSLPFILTGNDGYLRTSSPALSASLSDISLTSFSSHDEDTHAPQLLKKTTSSDTMLTGTPDFLDPNANSQNPFAKTLQFFQNDFKNDKKNTMHDEKAILLLNTNIAKNTKLQADLLFALLHHDPNHTVLQRIRKKIIPNTQLSASLKFVYHHHILPQNDAKALAALHQWCKTLAIDAVPFMTPKDLDHTQKNFQKKLSLPLNFEQRYDRKDAYLEVLCQRSPESAYAAYYYLESYLSTGVTPAEKVAYISWPIAKLFLASDEVFKSVEAAEKKQDILKTSTQQAAKLAAVMPHNLLEATLEAISLYLQKKDTTEYTTDTALILGAIKNLSTHYSDPEALSDEESFKEGLLKIYILYSTILHKISPQSKIVIIPPLYNEKAKTLQKKISSFLDKSLTKYCEKACNPKDFKRYLLPFLSPTIKHAPLPLATQVPLTYQGQIANGGKQQTRIYAGSEDATLATQEELSQLLGTVTQNLSSWENETERTSFQKALTQVSDNDSVCIGNNDEPGHTTLMTITEDPDTANRYTIFIHPSALQKEYSAAALWALVWELSRIAYPDMEDRDRFYKVSALVAQSLPGSYGEMEDAFALMLKNGVLMDLRGPNTTNPNPNISDVFAALAQSKGANTADTDALIETYLTVQAQA